MRPIYCRCCCVYSKKIVCLSSLDRTTMAWMKIVTVLIALAVAASGMTISHSLHVLINSVLQPPGVLITEHCISSNYKIDKSTSKLRFQ